MVFKEEHPTRTEAMQREIAIKKLTHAEKRALIQQDSTR
jgi:predicted GIY-YIG superfamily endonuclease